MELLKTMAFIKKTPAAHVYCRKKKLRNSRPYCLFIYMLSIILVITSACNPEEWEIVNCLECYTDQPSEATINVKLSTDKLNTSVIIDVYSGKLEEEILIVSDTVASQTWSTILPVNEYYTITATYIARTGDFNVTAIDGNLVKTRKITGVCDEPCWVVRGNNFNVKLKY